MKLVFFVTTAVLMFSNLRMRSQDSADVLQPKLSDQIKFGDIDHDGLLSKKEAWTVINQYYCNTARHGSSDLTNDVECVIIDIISYCEKINCAAIKNTPGAKRFIELYFLDRFASLK